MKNSIKLSTIILSAIFLTSIQAAQSQGRPGQVAKVQEKIEKLQKSLNVIKNTKAMLSKGFNDTLKAFAVDIKSLDYEVLGLSDVDFNNLQQSVIKTNKISTPLFNVFLAGKTPGNSHLIFANAFATTDDLAKQFDPKAKVKPTIVNLKDIVLNIANVIDRLGDDSSSFLEKNKEVLK